MRRPGHRRDDRPDGLPDRAHELVSFPDPGGDRTWVFDVTFLESNWRCIYGQGCQGVLTAPAPEREEGCCSYGAHFTGAADRRRVEAAAAQLRADEWQHQTTARRRGGPVRTAAVGEESTRIVAGACIFLNRPGFGAGAGCALHTAALGRGIEPRAWKPDVCWQIPFSRHEQTAQSGHVTVTVRQWNREDWGAGGSEFHWWCTEAPEAFVATEPVYQALRGDLEAMVGSDVYRELESYLRGRRVHITRLPHPALRLGTPPSQGKSAAE